MKHLILGYIIFRIIGNPVAHTCLDYRERACGYEFSSCDNVQRKYVCLTNIEIVGEHHEREWIPQGKNQ